MTNEIQVLANNHSAATRTASTTQTRAAETPSAKTPSASTDGFIQGASNLPGTVYAGLGVVSRSSGNQESFFGVFVDPQSSEVHNVGLSAEEASSPSPMLTALLKANAAGSTNNEAGFIVPATPATDIATIESIAEQVVSRIELSPGQELFRHHFAEGLKEDFVNYYTELVEKQDLGQLATLLNTVGQSHEGHSVDLEKSATEFSEALADYVNLDARDLDFDARVSLMDEINQGFQALLVGPGERSLETFAFITQEYGGPEILANLQGTNATDFVSLMKKINSVRVLGPRDNSSQRIISSEINEALSDYVNQIEWQEDGGFIKMFELLAKEGNFTAEEFSELKSALEDVHHTNASVVNDAADIVVDASFGLHLSQALLYRSLINNHLPAIWEKTPEELRPELREFISDISSKVSESQQIVLEAYDNHFTFEEAKYAKLTHEFSENPSFEAFREIRSALGSMLSQNTTAISMVLEGPQPSTVTEGRLQQLISRQNTYFNDLTELTAQIAEGSYQNYEFTEDDQWVIDVNNLDRVSSSYTADAVIARSKQRQPEVPFAFVDEANN